MDLAMLVGPVVSALLAFAGSYLALTDRLTRVEAKVDVLSDRVEKHNSLIERTARNETDIQNLYHRLDDMKIGD